MLCCRQKSAAMAGVRVAPATKRMCSLPWTLVTRLRPQVPMPTIAARITPPLCEPPADPARGRLDAQGARGRLCGSHDRNHFEVDQVAPVGHPFVEESRLRRLHHLVAGGEIFGHPA